MFSNLYPDIPTRTDQVLHDMDVGTPTPIKQYPYIVNLLKLKIIREEVTYMLENDLIEASSSEWSSSLVYLYQNLTEHIGFAANQQGNKSYPIPRVEICQ